MDIRIKPKKLSGAISLPSSKSFVHRAAFIGAMCENPVIIRCVSSCADIINTVNVISDCGIDIEFRGETIGIGKTKRTRNPSLHCGESGTTARFILPYAASLGEAFTVNGGGRLPERPFSDLCRVMREHGCIISSDNLPMTVSGKLNGGEYILPGGVSSQYISALLMVLPNLDNDSMLTVDGKLESALYVDLTICLLSAAGVVIDRSDNKYLIRGRQKYYFPPEITAESDMSSAAFWETANALGSDIKLNGIYNFGNQPDAAIKSILQNFDSTNEIDISQFPDLFPILAIYAMFSDKKTKFTNAARLRLKESDRISAMAEAVRRFGGVVSEGSDNITISRGSFNKNIIIDSKNDHRIVMSAAIAAASMDFDKSVFVIIKNAECADKSYPRFFEHFEALGGAVEVI